MNGLQQLSYTTHAPGEEEVALPIRPLIMTVVGATLPWLVGLLLVHVLQADLLGSAEPVNWLQMIGYLCWAVIIAQWALVLTVAIAYLMMVIKVKTLS